MGAEWLHATSMSSSTRSCDLVTRAACGPSRNAASTLAIVLRSWICSTLYLQGLRDQGKIGLANWGEQLHSVLETDWWLQWLERESLWATKFFPNDVITWNIGPQGVDLSIPQIAQTLSKGSAIVMLQEVSFHPGERRRIKSILKKIGPEYWCCMETSQRVRAGMEEKKVGVSNRTMRRHWCMR